jgi:hypothetical protein
MSQSNVVSVRFSTPECRSQSGTVNTDANIVPFPVRDATSPESLPFDARKTLHGTFAWASEVVAADRHLSHLIVETRKRNNRMLRETSPKPTFIDNALDQESREIAIAQHETLRRNLSYVTGLDKMMAEWSQLQRDIDEARKILLEAGLDPDQHHQVG